MFMLSTFCPLPILKRLMCMRKAAARPNAHAMTRWRIIEENMVRFIEEQTH